VERFPRLLSPCRANRSSGSGSSTSEPRDAFLAFPACRTGMRSSAPVPRFLAIGGDGKLDLTAATDEEPTPRAHPRWSGAHCPTDRGPVSARARRDAGRSPPSNGAAAPSGRVARQRAVVLSWWGCPDDG